MSSEHSYARGSAGQTLGLVVEFDVPLFVLQPSQQLIAPGRDVERAQNDADRQHPNPKNREHAEMPPATNSRQRAERTPHGTLFNEYPNRRVLCRVSASAVFNLPSIWRFASARAAAATGS